MTTLSFIAACFIVAIPVAQAGGAYADLEKCYQVYGQVETVEQSGKKVTTYKDQAQVAAECNEKVIQKAKSEQNGAKLMELAGVIGRNSNWASAMPIYVIAAKKDAQKICKDANVLDALENALARPGEDEEAKNGNALMAACWPKGKDGVVGMLKADQNGYVKQNVCAFLKTKNAIPKPKQDLCTGT